MSIYSQQVARFMTHRDQLHTEEATITTSTLNTFFISAPGAGRFIRVYALYYSGYSGSTNHHLTVNEGADAKFNFYIPASFETLSVHLDMFACPWSLPENTKVGFQKRSGGSSGTHSVTAAYRVLNVGEP